MNGTSSTPDADAKVTPIIQGPAAHGRRAGPGDCPAGPSHRRPPASPPRCAPPGEDIQCRRRGRADGEDDDLAEGDDGTANVEFRGGEVLRHRPGLRGPVDDHHDRLDGEQDPHRAGHPDGKADVGQPAGDLLKHQAQHGPCNEHAHTAAIGQGIPCSTCSV